MTKLIPNENGNYEFTKNELYSFVNSAMQCKADSDVKAGRSDVSFTPWYQIIEFMEKKGIIEI